MENNDLQKIWKEGSKKMLDDMKLDRGELETFLKPRVNKVTLSLNLNIFSYMAAQVAAAVLIGFNFYGYRSNLVMLSVLVCMLAVNVGAFGYGIFLLKRIRGLRDVNVGLMDAIKRKLRVYCVDYELWMWLGSFSAIVLIFALGFLVDNEDGVFRINNPFVFAGITVGALLFMYGAQKLVQFMAIGQMKAYLSDLENEALDESRRLGRQKKWYAVLFAVLFVVLMILFILGLMKNMQMSM
jgi:hypothetical protein